MIYDEFGGYWGEHPEYRLEDWKFEIENNDTRQGYWDWVQSRFEEENQEEVTE